MNHLTSSAHRDSRIRGARLAIVVDNKDGLGNPGYRVKVKLPWLNDQETTYWARIAVPMAGPGRGTYVLPEIDDQVLVVFEHGDIDRPIVIGGLWSNKQEPVEVNQSGKNNSKLIKSRCGHRIILDDKEGAEKITIVDRTNRNKIVLDSANKIVKIESDGDIEIRAKANVIMHSNALKVGTSQGVSGKAASLLIHAAKTFGVKASREITISGGNTTINTANAAACSVAGSGAGELEVPEPEQPKDPAVVHESGGGGAARSGGSGSGSGADSGPSTGGTNSHRSATSLRLTFVELKLVDSEGQPVPFARYHVTGSDGAMFTGALDAKGYARVDGIPEGMCKVTFPDVHGDDWSVA